MCSRSAASARTYTATLDTIVFEPDRERFTMSWRVARPLKKSMHEIAQVLVGKKGAEWWQQREQVAFPIPVVMVPMDSRRRPSARPRMSAQRRSPSCGTGLVTSVGLTAPACCAAFRAKITNPIETRFIDSGGDWIMAHQVALEQPWRGLTKLAKMAAMAIEEALQDLPQDRMARLPLLLCVAEAERPGAWRAWTTSCCRRSRRELGVRFAPQSAVVPHGRVGVAVALAQARALMARAQVTARADRRHRQPAVAGRRLSHYEREDRLLTAAQLQRLHARRRRPARCWSAPPTGSRRRAGRAPASASAASRRTSTAASRCVPTA